MTPPATATRQSQAGLETWTRLELLSWLGGLMFAAWLRAPALKGSGFASHDVAGILYNGMLLRRGLLPYVDSYELKPPGTFYLAALLAGPRATDIAAFQWWASIAALATAVAVGLSSRRLYGALAGVVALWTYLIVSADLDSMDANYVTWANLPQALAGLVGLYVVTGRHGSPESSAAQPPPSPAAARLVQLRPHALMLFAGGCGGLATLCKLPQGVVLVALCAWVLLQPGLVASHRVSLGLSVVLGAFAVHLPLVLHYMTHGELAALGESYPINRWGIEYLQQRGSVGPGSVREALAATAYFLALPLGLAALCLAREGPGAPRSPERWRTVAIVIWFVLTWSTTLLGQRFYKGYFLAPLVPLSVLGGLGSAEFALSLAALRRKRERGQFCRARTWLPVGSVHAAMALIVAVLLARQAGLDLLVRHDRARRLDEGGKVLAQLVRQRTTPDHRIWVWGWHLWDVYPYADRLSASPIYKALGVLTPPNDDTWRSAASPQRFIDGGGARRLLADLERTRPQIVLLGGTVPRDEFLALRSFLRAHYRRLASPRVGRVEIWELHDAAANEQGGGEE